MSLGDAPVSDKGVVRQVRVVGDPVLRSPCQEVLDFDERLSALIADMFATMYAVHGVGLAANQIGVSQRVFVFDCPDDYDKWHSGYIVNPSVTSVTGAEVEQSEGCLSVPGLYFKRQRPSHVVLDGFDVRGEPVRLTGSNYIARCLMHELNHLEGELYIDKLPPVERRKAARAISDPRFGEHQPASPSSRVRRRIRRSMPEI